MTLCIYIIYTHASIYRYIQQIYAGDPHCYSKYYIHTGSGGGRKVRPCSWNLIIGYTTRNSSSSSQCRVAVLTSTATLVNTRSCSKSVYMLIYFGTYMGLLILMQCLIICLCAYMFICLYMRSAQSVEPNYPPIEQSTHLLFWQIGKSESRWLEPWSSQTNHFKIDTCHFQARPSTLLGQDKVWLVQYQDNVTEWDIKSWCWWPAV